MSAFPQPCGRLDRHDEHDWTRPRDPWTAARDFHCAGRVLIEGGYWADWDASDDQFEHEVDRQRRETS